MKSSTVIEKGMLLTLRPTARKAATRLRAALCDPEGAMPWQPGGEMRGCA